MSWIRNKIPWCADKISDIVIFDWTIMAKNIKSNFSGFANCFFSNKDKKVVNLLDVFWASIITKTKIRYMLKKADAIYLEKWRMWVFKDVYLKSWMKKRVKIPVTIIVYHVNWAKVPMVIATSASLEDVYENMIRKEEIYLGKIKLKKIRLIKN